MQSLDDLLPELVPLAAEWAQRVCAQALADGDPLDDRGVRLARAVGVAAPQRVRIATYDPMPFPEHPMLRAAALQTGMLGPTMAGLTLGHSILLRPGEHTTRLLSHELRHVAQYEAAGSIEAFLSAYLAQIVRFGYHDAPFEVDARGHEIG